MRAAGKENARSSAAPGDEAGERRRVLPAILRFLAALSLAALAGCLAGLVLTGQLNKSQAAAQVAALGVYRPSQVTLVYADDGVTIIGEFALEKRLPLDCGEMPTLVSEAILAIEDVRFYEHFGIDPIRTIGALYKNYRTGSREGGSTITQQLAKNLFLSNEQTVERKMQEWALALQLERRYTKRQILCMYANHVFLGANSYGVEAAADTYFGKKAGDLTLEEAALLAAIPKAPSRYSPTVNSREARARRDLVLSLMAAHNFVAPEAAEAAKAKPIKLVDTAHYPPGSRATPFDYPIEEIRRYLEKKYTTRVAQGGLRVYTTVNIAAQKQAVEAVRRGLRRYDRTRGRWRGEYANILSEVTDAQAAEKRLKTYQHPHWYGNDYHKKQFVIGLVTDVDAVRGRASVRFGRYTATVGVKEMGRSGQRPEQEFKVGDLAEFEVREVDERRRLLKVALSQSPEVQGPLVALNAGSGEIVAMVGGYDFQLNQFNNATQARRQTGSAFKPFIYTAAVEWGYAPESTVSGAPIVVDDGRTRWEPRNYDGSKGGRDVPLKTALAKSLNIQAVHLLEEVGIHSAAQMVRRFGVTTPMAPYLPSALGATEVPLVEMVSAYSVFPNSGLRASPHLIRRVVDQDGRVLEERKPSSYRVTSEYVAATMVEMMRGVVEGGTAAPARALGVPLAGKTGTVNDHTDVWFIGYTPTYVAGVWMGYPEGKKSLGEGMSGARGALPVFLDFMKEFLRDKPREEFGRSPEPPPGLRALQLFRQERMKAERERQAAERAATAALESAGKYEPLPTLELEEVGFSSVTIITNESRASGKKSRAKSAPTPPVIVIEREPPPFLETVPARRPEVRPRRVNEPAKSPAATPRLIERPKKKDERDEGVAAEPREEMPLRAPAKPTP